MRVTHALADVMLTAWLSGVIPARVLTEPFAGNEHARVIHESFPTMDHDGGLKPALNALAGPEKVHRVGREA